MKRLKVIWQPFHWLTSSDVKLPSGACTLTWAPVHVNRDRSEPHVPGEVYLSVHLPPAQESLTADIKKQHFWIRLWLNARSVSNNLVSPDHWKQYISLHKNYTSSCSHAVYKNVIIKLNILGLTVEFKAFKTTHPLWPAMWRNRSSTEPHTLVQLDQQVTLDGQDTNIYKYK